MLVTVFILLNFPPYYSVSLAPYTCFLLLLSSTDLLVYIYDFSQIISISSSHYFVRALAFLIHIHDICVYIHIYISWIGSYKSMCYLEFSLLVGLGV